MTVDCPLDETELTAAPIAVVGVGNWLISYDRIGVKVLDMIEGRYRPHVALFDAGSGGLSLLDCINGQDLMLVVDACNTGGAPGDIKLVEAGDTGQLTSGPGLHQIGPMETLAVARHLFPENLPQRVLFILVETEGLDDEELNRSARQVVSIIDDEVKRYGENRLDLHEPKMNFTC